MFSWLCTTRAAMCFKGGNLGCGVMRGKFANQSGEISFSAGSASGVTQSTITYQTQSTANISSETPLSAGNVAYYRERQRNRVFEVVWLEFVNQSETNGLTKKAIAERLGKNPSQITRWFSGPANWELDTTSDLMLAMGCEMTIGCSSLLNRPTPNYIHPAATSPIGTWTNTQASAPANFVNGTTTISYGTSWPASAT
jgi:hypothetical protein